MQMFRCPECKEVYELAFKKAGGICLCCTKKKDKQIIIENEYGIECVAIWSEADKKFVYANLQTDMYDGKWNMNYFENEYILEKDIKKWREL